MVERETSCAGKDLLVVIETVNFNGGAHVATWAMIDALVARGWRVDVMTASEPTDAMRRRLAACTIHVMDAPFPRHGVRHVVQGVCNRLHLGWVPNWSIDPTGAARRLAANYKTVLVVGENSHLRNLVGSVKGPRKVVFVHTDYATWRTMRGCDRDDARCDRWTYRAFDVIGVVGKPNAARFAACFPAFAPKVRAFHNILPQAAETAAARGGAPDGVRSPANAVFKIASISRLEWGPQKKTELSIEVAARLKARGLAFDWSVYGDGAEPEVARLKAFMREKGVEDCFHLPGYTTDPRRAMREADVTTLFSAYEGVSNAIYESLLCGTPVLATDVGAASEQIRDGETGRVLPPDAAALADALADVIAHRERVAAWRRNLAGYVYDNEQVVREYEEILKEQTT